MKKFFITATVLIFVLLGAGACAANPTQSTDPTETPTPTLKEDLTVADFTIVYPKKTIFTSAEPETVSRTLWNAIKEATSSFVSVSDDEINEEYGFVENTYEILIGSTNREESADAATRHLKYYDYVIKYIDTKLVINAGSDEALGNAVDYFIENYVNTNTASTVDGWKEIMKLDYEYIYNSNIGTLTIDGVDISEFTICSSIPTVHTDKFIAELLEKAGEKLTCPATITNHAHEIIIGDCGKPEYDKAVEGLSGNEYVIDVIDGDLVIASASEAGLTHAMYAFYSEYLSKECETLNITSDIKYEYKRTYPIKSITLCGHDIKDYVIVANPDSKSLANRLSNEIEEMSGIVLDVVTDSPDNYDAAIVLCGVNDSTSKRILSTLADGKATAKSEGAKIYIGTNSISYGDSPAVNAFVTEILGYDMDRGIAMNEIIDVAEVDLTVDLEKYRDSFIITHYFGIRERFLVNADGTVNTWRIDEAVESGMNVLEINGSPEAVKQVLEYCDKRGDVRCCVRDGTLWRIINSTLDEEEDLYDGWMDDVKTIVDRYKDYSSLYSYNLGDEPPYNDFILKKIGAVCALFKELDPARLPYINQGPLVDKLYNAGLNQYGYFIDCVGTDIVSYDRYVFDDNGGKMNERIPFYYFNMELAREAALERNIKYMNIALLVDHYYGLQESTNYIYLDDKKISWEAFTSLAYGVSTFSYFTYASPTDSEGYPWVYNPEGGIVSIDGEKTEHYYDVQKINKRLQIMGDVLVDRLSLGVFQLHPEKVVLEGSDTEYDVCATFEGYGTIEEIIAPDVTIGFFEDNFMLIASKDFENPIDVEVKTSSKLLILDNDTGEWSELESKNFSLEAGSAALIKITE